MEVFWSDEDQLFRTVPDGDIASHKQIKEAVMSNYVGKSEISKMIREINIDIERNEKRKIEQTENEKYTRWTDMKVCYDPVLVKLRLENILRR